ncbi:ClpX C4-type zinc finger protein [Nocardia tenerifensis]|uniref:ClpX C4-type zinc finger protein n=1 Tax=Nocardia tenerifensis TaxID=228006 RepID=A0A318KA59_9NOCA|nr:ClpX C4-type zinc finger protein [Nocardia tenerifensis]PXX70986.1 ClpX C4-type zinc finger protein [Nocardia tenerifensis]
MTDTPADFIAHCSFCRRPNTEVSTLVAGPGVFICDDCVTIAAQIVAGATPGEGARVAPWSLDMPLASVLAGLGPVAAAGAQADRNLRLWVAKARTLGATWTQIGQALGMTRQSAWERYAADSRDMPEDSVSAG